MNDLVTENFAECFIGNMGARVKVIDSNEERAIQRACSSVSLREASFLKESVQELRKKCDCKITAITYNPDIPPPIFCNID